MNASAPRTETAITDGGFEDALEAATANSDDVDRRARFPSETVAALRAAGALGWLVPRELGGAGRDFASVCDATFQLSRRCASSGMIFGMHQIQVASITRHCGESFWFRDYLNRVAREQRLIASATSEVGVGGDLRRSIAAIEPVISGQTGLSQFEKNASTISYGAAADDLLTTVRRSTASEPGDQVMVLTHFSEMEIEPRGVWDTLGMRGTVSPGFLVRARFPATQVLPAPFAVIAAETMVPVSHILWAHVWLGIASDAYDRSQNFVRSQARHKPGSVPPSALVLSSASLRLAELRAMIRMAIEEYNEIADEPRRLHLSSMGYALRINQLKIIASERVAEICGYALRICGFAGYQNDGPFSVGRQLRDSSSAALMVANDRLNATNASLVLMHREGR